MAIYTNGKYLKNQPTAVNPKRKPKKKKFKIRLSPLMKKVIAYVLVVAILVTVPVIVQHKHDKEKYEIQIAELTAQHEQEIADLIAAHETEVFNIHQAYEYGGDVNSIEAEAEYVAKVIYGTAKNHAETDQRAVVWCILNRVESPGYPNSIREVCQQPKQWINYSDDNPVLETHYELALEILKTWYTGGHRPMNKDFVFLTWSSEEIILRNTFVENKDTRYYRFY